MRISIRRKLERKGGSAAAYGCRNLPFPYVGEGITDAMQYKSSVKEETMRSWRKIDVKEREDTIL
jgi:hypothetical protein